MIRKTKIKILNLVVTAIFVGVNVGFLVEDIYIHDKEPNNSLWLGLLVLIGLFAWTLNGVLRTTDSEEK